VAGDAVDVFTFSAVCAVGTSLCSRLQCLTRKIESLEKENASLRDQLHKITTRVFDLETTLW